MTEIYVIAGVFIFGIGYTVGSYQMFKAIQRRFKQDENDN